MVNCSVIGCKSRTERKYEGVTFHRFPRSQTPHMRMKWIESTGRSNWQPTSISRICSRHFAESSFLKKGHKGHVYLKPNSIPTLFIQKEEFVDMTLAADGHLVKVHRNIMSLASPYIKEMLQSTACRDPVVFLNDVSYQVLSYILEYIYTGEVKVPKYTLNTFIKAAKSLHISGIKDLLAPMVPQEFSQSLSETSSKRHDRHPKATAAVEKRTMFYVDSNADEGNTEKNEESQPVAQYVDQPVANINNISRLKDTMDPQIHCEDINIDCADNVNQLMANIKDNSRLKDIMGLQTHCEAININCDDNYDVDMALAQIINTQTIKEQSILEQAMENITCEDAKEADKLVQHKANIILNFDDDGSSRFQKDSGNITLNFEDGCARLQNDSETAAPNINFEIQSCPRGNENEYPSISISFNDNTLIPELASDRHANLNTETETHDASAPLYSLSERGSLQIILNRFIYNMHHSSNKKLRWRCADYRKLNCKAYIDTSFDEIVERKNEHTHGFHDAKILKKGEEQNIYSTIAEAEASQKAHEAEYGLDV